MKTTQSLVVPLKDVRGGELYEPRGLGPSRLLVKVFSDPGVGLDGHQRGHVHLLDVVGGGQHDLVGVGL